MAHRDAPTHAILAAGVAVTDLARFGFALIGFAGAVVVIGVIIGLVGKALARRD